MSGFLQFLHQVSGTSEKQPLVALKDPTGNTSDFQNIFSQALSSESLAVQQNESNGQTVSQDFLHSLSTINKGETQLLTDIVENLGKENSFLGETKSLSAINIQEPKNANEENTSLTSFIGIFSGQTEIAITNFNNPSAIISDKTDIQTTIVSSNTEQINSSIQLSLVDTLQTQTDSEENAQLIFTRAGIQMGSENVEQTLGTKIGNDLHNIKSGEQKISRDSQNQIAIPNPDLTKEIGGNKVEFVAEVKPQSQRSQTIEQTLLSETPSLKLATRDVQIFAQTPNEKVIVEKVDAADLQNSSTKSTSFTSSDIKENVSSTRFTSGNFHISRQTENEQSPLLQLRTLENSSSRAFIQPNQNAANVAKNDGQLNGKLPLQSVVSLEPQKELLTDSKKNSTQVKENLRSEIVRDGGVKITGVEKSEDASLTKGENFSKTENAPQGKNNDQVLVKNAGEQIQKNTKHVEQKEEIAIQPQIKNKDFTEVLQENVATKPSSSQQPSADLTSSVTTRTSDTITPRTEVQSRYSTALSEQWSQKVMEDLGKSTLVKVSDEVSEIRLRLQPENLGRLLVDIKTSGGKMTAQIVVSNNDVKHALEMNLPVLQDALAQRGIEMKNVEVFEQNSHQQQHHQKNEKPFDERNQNKPYNDERAERFARYFGNNTMEFTA